MSRLFWNKEKTRESFDVLEKLSRELDFVLIGEWAVYFYVKQQESLDIDIALDYSKVYYFKQFGLEEYENTKISYSIINGIYVDIFATEMSDGELPIPASEILKNYVSIEGIKVVEKEMLLLLKLWAYFRNDEVKVRKDVIDAVSLFLYGKIDLKKFKAIIDANDIERRRSVDVLLEYLDKGETLVGYIGISSEEYAERKKRLKKEILGLFGPKP